MSLAIAGPDTAGCWGASLPLCEVYAGLRHLRMSVSQPLALLWPGDKAATIVVKAAGLLGCWEGPI